VPTPQQQGGGLSEASRLLQEGLALLDDRTREVDAAVRIAERRVREMTAAAQQRAAEITAEAERQRSELEKQVGALRNEVAATRKELAELKSSARDGGRAPPAAMVPASTPAPRAAPAAPSLPRTAAGVTEESPPLIVAPDASEPAGTPRWGRPSTTAAVQQAVRERGSRPRWLPPWLPFVIVLMAAAGVVAANVDNVGGARGLVGDTFASATATRDVIVVTFAPTQARLATGPPGLTVAAATSIATSIAVVAGSLPLSTPSQAPTRAPALTVSGAQATPIATSTPAPRLTPTLASSRQPIVLPPAPAPLAPLIVPPDALSPEGPIVAAYTAYTTYTVKPGDTLNHVATDFGVSGESIVRASGLSDPNLLQPGQVLTIPRDSGWLYRVQGSETLEQIASRFGVSVDVLFMASKLSSPIVRTGDLLFIPNPAIPPPKS
jgi:LysM repeat protein